MTQHLNETTAFSANCQACGAQVGVDLTKDELHCSNCGSDNPLTGKVHYYFKEIRNRLKSQDVLKQKVQHKNFVHAREFKVSAILIGAGTWLFALGFWSIMYFPNSVRGDINWWELLSHKQDFSISGNIYYPLFWWMAYINITGIILTFLAIQWGLYYFKKFPSLANALPPASKGAPPRCRCCGAELSGDGVQRACNYCGADNIVSGQVYEKQFKDTEEALRKMLQGVKYSVQDKFNRTKRIEKILIANPAIVSIFLPWLLIFINVSYSFLWILPFILLIVAFYLYFKTKAYNLEGFNSVYYLKMGCLFYLNDELLEVVAKFMANTGIYGEAQDAYVVKKNDNQLQIVVLTYSKKNEPDAFLYLPADDNVKFFELELTARAEIKKKKFTASESFFLYGNKHVWTYCPVKNHKRYVYVWGEESVNKKTEADLSYVFSGHFNADYIRF
ncbi:MAG: hypothetical protein JXB49_00620 [Bacteroidales bacterium]|nr:hypothetical protein [Bacteroidales bacterium]